MKKRKINKTDWSASVPLATSPRGNERAFCAGALMASETLALQSMLKIFFVVTFLISCFFVAACEPAPSMMVNRSTPLPPSENREKLTSLEREIRDAENGGFKVILVFKRKDGGVFDSDDKKYLSANKPADINRSILTDDKKAVVVGSNFLFPPENMKALQKRFVVEDHSKPAEMPQANGTTNEKP